MFTTVMTHLTNGNLREPIEIMTMLTTPFAALNVEGLLLGSKLGFNAAGSLAVPKTPDLPTRVFPIFIY